jgi:hypothetical protein
MAALGEEDTEAIIANGARNNCAVNVDERKLFPSLLHEKTSLADEGSNLLFQ